MLYLFWCEKRDLLRKSEKKSSNIVQFFFSKETDTSSEWIGSREKKNIDFHHSPLVLVYAFHLAFMTLFGFASMHVQVSVNMFLNRFVCCSKEKNVKTEVRDYRQMIFVLL